MKRNFLASILGAVALLLAAGVGTATGASPGVQTVGQSAGNAQQATSASGATQIAPSNSNISVRVLSPGNDGAVTQSNTASSDASSSNSNATTQDAGQSQAGGGIQTAQQGAGNLQASTALSGAYQAGASNKNLDVRVLSPGYNDAVTQSNDASSKASSTNANTTDQTSDQTQSGSSSCGCAPPPPPPPYNAGSCGCAPQGTTDAPPPPPGDGGSGTNVQSADQSAENVQLAGAASSAKQVDPENSNISVRVLSPGNDGSVTQSNSVSSDATASNTNTTGQDSDQYQGGGSCGCSSPTDIQVGKQSAGSLQVAGAGSKADQIGAKNTNLPVRVLSPGNDGSVTQSNSVSSTATSTNTNQTKQDTDQTQRSSGGCGCGSGDPIQVAEQSSGSLQGAVALSAAGQLGAKNESSPVRVGSSGNGGKVEQSNSVTSDASSTNTNSTTQDADQTQSSPQSPCGCGGDDLGIQVLGQQAVNGQAALSASGALQDFGGKTRCGCDSGGNASDPVRVWSPGSDGSVEQSNSASSTADSTNSNSTSQDADQQQAGSGIEIQALAQKAENGQLAGALSGTFQLDPSNRAGGDRVYSPGSGGSVDQSNDASSEATAANTNGTWQDADQSQSGSGGCGCGSDPQIQALGQQAGSLQVGLAFSTVLQHAPKNSSGGTAVWSPSAAHKQPLQDTQPNEVGQRNTASSTGGVTNGDSAWQDAMQMQ